VKAFSLLAAAAFGLSFGVAAASVPAPAPTYRTQLLESDDSVDLAIADFNGDGRNEIATANYNPGSVTVGDHEYDVGGLTYLVEPHDLNGDGKPDLLVEAEGDTGDFVSVLLNQGSGVFDTAKDVLDNAGSLTVGDFTGDRKPDIVSVTNKLTVLVNHGAGTFAEPTTYDIPEKPSAAAIGEGIIALTSKGGTLSVFRSDGARVDYPTGARPSRPAVGDVNGDGEADVIVASAQTGTVDVFIGGQRRNYPAMPGVDWVDIRDVNGDAKPDLLLHGTSTKVFGVLLNAGDGTFKPARWYATWRDSWVEAVRDVNGDGAPDVVMLAADAQVVSLLLNRGDGTFEPKLDYIPALELWGGTVAVGDLNGDKRPELVVPVGSSRNGSTYLSVFTNKPGLCNVQLVGGMTLAAAKQQLARVNCRVGKVRRVFSNWVAKGRVLAQKPRFGSELRGGTRIDLVVSKGPWR
jgi:FG-GAP-like repeat/PASTA domain/FG-GAP repeat